LFKLFDAAFGYVNEIDEHDSEFTFVSNRIAHSLSPVLRKTVHLLYIILASTPMYTGWAKKSDTSRTM